MIRIFTFYLPQFHQIPENDYWYGEGFTEWTNVTKAKKLFPGHYQPNLPSDLGFYDLTNPNTLFKQANLAKKYGVDSFIFWHYWFGNGERLLYKPLTLFLENLSISIEFSLAWANHNWEKKLWKKNVKNELIKRMDYSKNDYEAHFYQLLKAFQDKRYSRIDGKLVFFIYNPHEIPNISSFFELWQRLSSTHNLGGFHFIGRVTNGKLVKEVLNLGFDSVYDDSILKIHTVQSIFSKVSLLILRKIFSIPTIFHYKNAIKFMVPKNFNSKVIPVIAPNWDHSPRSGHSSIILHGANPRLFKDVLLKAFEYYKNSNNNSKIILIKSWNEWGEGNYLEPDIRFGKKNLEMIKLVKDSQKND